MIRTALIVLLSSWTISEIAAQQPAPQAPEQIPAPKQWIPPAPAPGPLPVPLPGSLPSIQYIPHPILPPPPPPRLDSRNAWALFAVDQSGHFRYRVVLSPYGSYYLYNGQPYYGTTTQQLYFAPRTTD
jgi:hypothetical protein